MLRYRLETDDAGVTVIGDRIGDDDADVALTLTLGAGTLRAGLINAHDHLHRNHYPRLGSPPYDDAYAWGLDIHERCAAAIADARTLPRRDALLFGALKNLVGGVTTAVHHDRREPDFDRDFPVRVPRVRTVHSLRFDAAGVAAARRTPDDTPLMIHLAEGVTTAAADEVRELDRAGLLDLRVTAVHCVGVDADGIERLRRARAAVAWCPTANAFLFGRTAPAALLAAVDVLLGTDALLTGAGTILDELAAARDGGLVTDARLGAAVADTAAHRLGLPLPRVEPGAPADLVLLRRPLLDATPADVALVVVGGSPRYGDVAFAPLFEVAGVACENIVAHGRERLVCRPLGTVAERVVERWPECARVFGVPDNARRDARVRGRTRIRAADPFGEEVVEW